MPHAFTASERRSELITAFSRLYELYGDGPFSVVTTCNVVLRGNSSDTFSVYYGQAYGDLAHRQHRARRVKTVKHLGDVGSIEVAHSLEDFGEVFLSTHSDSNVTVDSIINVVFLITRPLQNFNADAISNRQHRRVYGGKRKAVRQASPDSPPPPPTKRRR